MKNVLITGASGFAGGHLAEYLLSLGHFNVVGTYNKDEHYLRSPLKDKIKFQKIDLNDISQVNRLLSSTEPDYIFHLAALTVPSLSFKEPMVTFNTNIGAEVNIFETIRMQNSPQTRIIVVSSSEIYGVVKPEDLPVNEENKLRPASPYAVSKIAQDYLGFQYNFTYKMNIIRVRPFNHIGPRHSEKFIDGDFSKQIAEIEKDMKVPIIYAGNLDAKRDWTDVRDVVKAYLLLMEKGIPGEVYNIGSGSSRSAKDLLDIMLSLSSKKIAVKKDPIKFRPSDIPDIVCDNTKLSELTGWKPSIPVEKTLQDTLDYWRGIV